MKMPEKLKKRLNCSTNALALLQRLEAENIRLRSERDALMNDLLCLESKVPKWIGAKEPPEKWKTEDGTLVNYQIYNPVYGVDIGNYHAPSKTWLCVGLPCKVSHWMPLLEPPEV